MPATGGQGPGALPDRAGRAEVPPPGHPVPGPDQDRGPRHSAGCGACHLPRPSGVKRHRRLTRSRAQGHASGRPWHWVLPSMRSRYARHASAVNMRVPPIRTASCRGRGREDHRFSSIGNEYESRVASQSVGLAIRAPRRGAAGRSGVRRISGQISARAGPGRRQVSSAAWPGS
jgi:hypothetical protein